MCLEVDTASVCINTPCIYLGTLSLSVSKLLQLQLSVFSSSIRNDPSSVLLDDVVLPD